jgi:hypothetical protein
MALPFQRVQPRRKLAIPGRAAIASDRLHARARSTLPRHRLITRRLGREAARRLLLRNALRARRTLRERWMHRHAHREVLALDVWRDATFGHHMGVRP